MGKIKLLLNVGTCFSATSPFHYTVSLDHQCVFNGHGKEPQYLYHLMAGTKQLKKDIMKTTDKTRPKDDFNKKYGKPDLLTQKSKYIVGKWTEEQETEFFRSPMSIDKYIRYYQRHWENVKHDYEWVGDFSNQSAVLTIPFMASIKDQLLEHFDVKVTMQFRDPVRRLFSVANKCVKNKEYSKWKQEKNRPYPDRVERNKQVNETMTPIQVMYKWLSGAFEPNAYYTQIYRRHAQIWGKENVKAIIMEEFHNPDNEKEQLAMLSDFFDYKFTKIHENVYYPDMGSNPPRLDWLSDQWSSDIVDITDDQYKKCRQLMNQIYKEFEKTFGYIPDEWGK